MTFKENLYPVDRDNAGLKPRFSTRCSCHVVKAVASTDGCYLERNEKIKITGNIQGEKNMPVKQDFLTSRQTCITFLLVHFNLEICHKH